jgi:serine/threonine protein phosphatase PrpC
MPFWKRRHQEAEAPTPPAKRVGVAFGVATHVGRVRPTNQDHVFALQISLPGPNGQESMGLFLVADGMGGHIGGATASARAIEIVTGEMLRGLVMPVLRGEPPAAIQDLMREAVLTANRRILDEAAQQHNDMGTTLTAALLVAGRCYQAHVGDSRLYTHTAAGLQCRTRDHSMVARLLELGQISPEEAHRHPKRNYLYQSVGQQDDIEVESDSFALDDYDYLLLCSDGLWGMVDEPTLHQTLSAGREVQEICERLVAQANDAGGEDNISVIVVGLPQA